MSQSVNRATHRARWAPLASIGLLCGVVAMVAPTPAGAQDDAATAVLSTACTTGPFRLPATLQVRAGAERVEVVAGDVTASLEAEERETLVVPTGITIGEITLNGSSDGVLETANAACPPPEFYPDLTSAFQVTLRGACTVDGTDVGALLAIEQPYRASFGALATIDLIINGETTTVELASPEVIELDDDAVVPPVVTFAGLSVDVYEGESAVGYSFLNTYPACDSPSPTSETPPSSTDDPPSSNDDPPSSGNDGAPISTPLSPKFTG